MVSVVARFAAQPPVRGLSWGLMGLAAVAACTNTPPSTGASRGTSNNPGSTGPSTSASTTTNAGSDTATTTTATAPTTGSESDTIPIFDVVGTVDAGIKSVCTVTDGELSGIGPCEQVAPPDSFEPDVQWSFPGVGAQTNCLTTPLVANLTDDNGDGEIDLCDIPDVVAVIGAGGETSLGNVVVLDGETGAMHFMVNTPVVLGVTPAIGDIDGDGLIEIVALGQNAALVVFEHDGSLKEPFAPHPGRTRRRAR